MTDETWRPYEVNACPNFNHLRCQAETTASSRSMNFCDLCQIACPWWPNVSESFRFFKNLPGHVQEMPLYIFLCFLTGFGRKEFWELPLLQELEVFDRQASITIGVQASGHIKQQKLFDIKTTVLQELSQFGYKAVNYFKGYRLDGAGKARRSAIKLYSLR